MAPPPGYAQPNTLADLQLRNPDVVRASGDKAWTYRVTVVNTGVGYAELKPAHNQSIHPGTDNT